MDVLWSYIAFIARLDHDVGVLEELALHLRRVDVEQSLARLGNTFTTPSDQDQSVKRTAWVLDTGKPILDATIHELLGQVLQSIAGCLDLELIARLVEDRPVVVFRAVHHSLVSRLQVWS